MEFTVNNVKKYLTEKGYKYANANFYPYMIGPPERLSNIDIFFDPNEQDLSKIKEEHFTKRKLEMQKLYYEIAEEDWNRLLENKQYLHLWQIQEYTDLLGYNVFITEPIEPVNGNLYAEMFKLTFSHENIKALNVNHFSKVIDENGKKVAYIHVNDWGKLTRKAYINRENNRIVFEMPNNGSQTNYFDNDGNHTQKSGTDIDGKIFNFNMLKDSKYECVDIPKKNVDIDFSELFRMYLRK